jgi:hypothetical protein
METSLLLAKILGSIYLVIGLGILINQDYFRSVAKEVAASPALVLLTGLLSLILGSLIVAIHNVWEGWPVVITILGWLAVLRGVLRIIVPQRAMEIAEKMTATANSVTAAALVALALGAYLAAMGYWLGPMG